MKYTKSITMKFYPIIAVIMLLSACNTDTKDEGLKVDEQIPVSILSLAQGKGESITETTGLFTTDDETLLSFKNGGVIERVYVKEGDLVKKGQLLAILNLTELNAKATQAKLSVEKAERDFKRAQKLYKDSVVTMEQYENAKTYLDVVKEDLNTIQFNLRYSEIRATTDGYVLLRLANEGQIVGPGTPVLQINGAKKGNWVVKIGISDRQWASIQEGDSAIITTDAFSDEIPAKVLRKSEGLNPNTGTFTIQVQPVSIGKLPIASGMFAKVKVFGQSSDSWIIPYDALLDGDAGRGYVFITDDNKTVKKIQVKIDAIQKENVIISSGLENYKSVITSGSPYLKEGSKIKIVK
jgi:RND family efflux transporter MFP subunit